MSMLSQKNAVVNEVNTILGSSFDPSTPARDQLTKDQISTIKANIVSGIMGGSISFSKDITTIDIADVKKYVNGMVSNHFRKAKELNGNTSYAPSSSGRGSRDPQVAALNKLLATLTEGTEDYNQVLEEIASRKAVLASEKAEQAKEKKAQKELAAIDVDSLPDNLKDIAHGLVNSTVN